MVRSVYRLRRAGHFDAWDWTPAQVYFGVRELAEGESDAMKRNAVAGRLAQAETKDFSAFMKE